MNYCEVECLTLRRFGYLSFYCSSFRVKLTYSLVISIHFDSVVVAVRFFIVG